MNEQYLLSIKKTTRSDKYSSEQVCADIVIMKKMIIEGSFPKKQIINIISDEAEKLRNIKKVITISGKTLRRTEFPDMHNFLSSMKAVSINQFCQTEILIMDRVRQKNDGDTIISFVIEPYLDNIKGAPKLLKLEIKDFFTGELILERNHSNFKSLENNVYSLINASHKDFHPSNPCVNRDCQFFVNDCDITQHFLGQNDLNINCYKVDGVQVFEYINYLAKSKITIHQVLAIEENNPLPRTVYSLLCDETTTMIWERGFDKGYKWECDVKSLFSKDDLYWKLNACVNAFDEASFEELLDEYSNVQPISHFIGIEMTCQHGVYESKIYKFYLKIEHPKGKGLIFNGKGIKIVVRQKETNYDYYIPTHEKWTYDDFDLV